MAAVPTEFRWKILKRALMMGVLFTLLDIAIAFNVWTKGEYIFGIPTYPFLHIMFALTIFSPFIFMISLVPQYFWQLLGMSIIVWTIEDPLFFLLIPTGDDPLIKGKYWIWGANEYAIYISWELFWALFFLRLIIGYAMISRPIGKPRFLK
ncbi:hypothetical protein J7L60_04735 [Candidatus Bathyarchaeota archaeon]|nr:hypothetical protein [Candidatus Bathyarchaeota archaeon]